LDAGLGRTGHITLNTEAQTIYSVSDVLYICVCSLTHGQIMVSYPRRLTQHVGKCTHTPHTFPSHILPHIPCVLTALLCTYLPTVPLGLTYTHVHLFYLQCAFSLIIWQKEGYFLKKKHTVDSLIFPGFLPCQMGGKSCVCVSGPLA
jgi:hypothetical protein